MTNKDIEDFLLESCGDTENIFMLDEDYAPAFIGVTSDGSASAKRLPCPGYCLWEAGTGLNTVLNKT